MMIANGISYDNTLSIKNLANDPETQKLIDNIPSGNETQIYSIGQKVNTNGIEKAIITDVYNQNGYYYYELTWTNKRKVYTKNARQKDIILIEGN